MKNKTIKALYISYNAITEPIVQSQVIPYLRELSKKGIKFYLLTFEKKKLKRMYGIMEKQLRKPTFPARPQSSIYITNSLCFHDHGIREKSI